LSLQVHLKGVFSLSYTAIRELEGQVISALNSVRLEILNFERLAFGNMNAIDLKLRRLRGTGI
jgi:hypothetical protein